MTKLLPIGTRVVPLRKTVGCPFRGESNWERAKEKKQPFLYITRYIDKEVYGVPAYNCSDKYPSGAIAGNHYAITDLILFNMTLKEFAEKNVKE